MYQNPGLAQALARDRIAELHLSAGATPSQRGPRLAIIETARNWTGWLLVDIGLRLALPRGTANARPHRGRQSISV